MGYISTGMGDHFSALLVSPMTLQLVLVDQNPFQPCFGIFLSSIDGSKWLEMFPGNAS